MIVTYVLAMSSLTVTSVAVVGRGIRTTTGDGLGGATGVISSFKATIQGALDGNAQLSGDVVVGQDFHQKALQFIKVLVTGEGSTASLGSTFKSPWLRARLCGTTANHALGITGSQGTRDTMDVDASRKVIDSNERSQRPIGAAAKERRTNLRAHRGCCSGCPS